MSTVYPYAIQAPNPHSGLWTDVRTGAQVADDPAALATELGADLQAGQRAVVWSDVGVGRQPAAVVDGPALSWTKVAT